MTLSSCIALNWGHAQMQARSGLIWCLYRGANINLLAGVESVCLLQLAFKHLKPPASCCTFDFVAFPVWSSQFSVGRQVFSHLKGCLTLRFHQTCDRTIIFDSPADGPWTIRMAQCSVLSSSSSSSVDYFFKHCIRDREQDLLKIWYGDFLGPCLWILFSFEISFFNWDFNLFFFVLIWISPCT